MEGLLRIGDFGVVCGLNLRTLRHYQDMGLLEPAHVDPVTGYRWYRPDQAGRALVIRRLRELDVSLPDVAAILAVPDADRRTALLDRHRARLQSQRDDVDRRLAAIADLLEEPTMPITVTDTWVEPVTVVSRRITGPTGLEQAVTAAGIFELMEELRPQGIVPLAVPILLVHGGDETTFEQEACLPVPEGTPGSWVLDGTAAGVTQHTGRPEDGNAVLHALIGEVVAAHGSIRMPFRIRLLAMPPIWGEGPVPRFELVVPYDS